MLNKLFLFCILFSLIFVSCKKDEDTEAWVSATTDYAIAEAYISEVFKIVDEAAKNEPNVFKLTSLDCSNIALEADTPGVFPQILVINFGEVNCIGSDGRRKRGVVKADFNGRYSEPGTVVKISFNNFFINDYKLTANNFTLTNNGNPILVQHHLSFPNLRFLNPSGQTIDVNGTRTFKLIAGDGTQAANDDVFHITGSFSGKDRRGSSVTATITDALQLNYECRSITSGLLNVVVGADGVFNYGDANCDDAATMTIDGRPFFINLE